MKLRAKHSIARLERDLFEYRVRVVIQRIDGVDLNGFERLVDGNAHARIGRLRQLDEPLRRIV